ncbi:Uncharacterised protein [Shigella sonnei]|nr:Uncharacterised protein [Shigella sonnei]
MLVTDHFSTQTQYTTFIGITLDNLHTLPRLPQTPVLFFRLRIVLFQRFKTILFTQHHLTHQVFHQIEIIQPDVHHRHHVRGGGGTHQIPQ